MALLDNVSSWSQPLGEEAPAGQNLEYDAEFLQLETAARVQPEQEFANSDAGTKITIEGQGPDWQEVRRLCESLMGRTRDLRVSLYYIQALLHTEGFSGFCAGLSLLFGQLEKLWEHVHPQIDADEDHDPTMRMNALMPLVATDAVLGDLRSSWLLRSRQFGVLTVRDVEVSQGHLPARDGENVYSEAQIVGILGEALSQDTALEGNVSESIRLLSALSDLLQERIGASFSIDFKPLRSILQCVQRAFQHASPADVTVAALETGEVSLRAADNVGLAIPAYPPVQAGGISGRQEIVQILEQLVQYLEKNEPANPAQLLLRRAQRVMHMGFLEAIEELAPDGLQQAERAVGRSLAREQG